MPPARVFDAEAKVSALAIHPNGSEFAASLKNGKVQVFSRAGKALRSVSPDARASTLAYTGDGRRILTGCGKSLAVFDAATGGRVGSWEAHREDVAAMASSRDGSLLASTSGYEPVRLWKGDGTPLRTLDSGPEVLGVAVSPGGDRVAEGSSDTRVRIFSAAGGGPPRVLEFSMACPVLAFSPDGRLLAAGSVDGTVSIFDAASGEPRGVLGRHSIPAGAAAFSLDGRRLATTSISLNPWGADADWKLWDLSSKRETTSAMGPSFANAVAFAAAVPVVVSARDQTLSVWD